VAGDLDAVADAVRSCGSVSDLSSGPSGTVATYLPGRKVPGVRMLDGEVEIHVVARWDAPVARVAEEIRKAVIPHVGATAITVYVDDVEDPPSWPEPSGAWP
jgi:hypothetical protein